MDSVPNGYNFVLAKLMTNSSDEKCNFITTSKALIIIKYVTKILDDLYFTIRYGQVL